MSYLLKKGRPFPGRPFCISLYTLLRVGDMSLTYFTNFGFLPINFLLIQNLNANATTNGAGTPTARYKFSQAFASMCFGHFNFLPATFRPAASWLCVRPCVSLAQLASRRPSDRPVRVSQGSPRHSHDRPVSEYVYNHHCAL